MPELALLVGKKGSELSSDVQRRQTGRRKGFLKVRSKSNRKHSLLTVWSKMGVEREAASGAWPGEKGEQTCPPQPAACPLCCQLPAVVGEEGVKHGGKQVEPRGERQADRYREHQWERQADGITYKSAREGDTEKRGGVS